MEVADAWASLLPDDLLLDIFRRLGGAAVMRCAGVCKPWRRAIMGNASTLHPRPDVFVPSLHLGFVPTHYINGSSGRVWLHRTPASSQPVLPEPDANGYRSFAPTPGGGSGWVLSSRDGFLLIKRGGEFDHHDLYLWNLVTGAWTFLPMASLGGGEAYTLATSYDDQQTVSTSSELEVRILAVKVNDGNGCWNSFHYQLFTATPGSHGGGAWGPVQRSQDFDGSIVISMHESTEVVCRSGAVHWLACYCACTVALDVRTGQTWTTELPLSGIPSRGAVVLATSRDGQRLSVIRWSKEQEEIQVWVLTGSGGDNNWILQRVIDVRKLVPGTDDVWVWMNVFCPRSGCLHAHVNGQMLLLDVDKGSSTHIHQELDICCRPYHMDWSSYWSMCVSKMKYF